jgi:hypothetical protein
MSIYVNPQEKEDVLFYSELQSDEAAGVIFAEPIEGPLELTIRIAGGILAEVTHPAANKFDTPGSYWKFLGLVSAKVDELLEAEAGAGGA